MDSNKYAINTNAMSSNGISSNGMSANYMNMNMDMHQTGSKVITESKFDIDAYRLELEKEAALHSQKQSFTAQQVSYTTPTNHFAMNVN